MTDITSGERATGDQSEEAAAEPVKCTECGAALSFETVTQLMDRSRVSFNIVPHPGEFLAAQTVGRTLDHLSKALIAASESVDVKAEVLVEAVTSDSGAFKFDLVVARRMPGVKKRAKTSERGAPNTTEPSNAEGLVPKS